LLKQVGEQPVTVFAMWQPMLPTDWSPPASLVLSRMADVRVRQFWDPNHLMAKRLAADAKPPQPEPDCCEQEGILWDLAVVYAPDAVWGQSLPTASFVNGPVVAAAEDLGAAVRKLLGGPSQHSSTPAGAQKVTERDQVVVLSVRGMT
jgi:hypothetical protein